ncbi:MULTISPECIES: Hsp20 family protein [unclassified Mesorhizobium]|uniref:Hsp20 family protein n=1 Tax=unclassified Mesorhizobium TaxID=325217 RepID=UPI001126DDCD|nr:MULTISPECIES: Hsp20 family protein [unclassified Mesorhizobium]MBZ9918635.1 Hsp20 family protein [Mesorhizobium sp. BR1-1-7]MBZ9952129.1 Hsp20 family protein [Mesorhizobium sp. BR1-1-15]MBZ9959088.1 Hsp20 family protein [Mesorhizobium sp. BR1-1-14]MBZ9969958.1 Hsp20 family protein [Mesorhizobium sp. BR1-1-12]MBZ9980755.1 Hsp20 family protein [Mesorhizobium sp. BR-1-1-8]
MRSVDFAPLYRTTVGFDRLFDMLDSSIRSDWPPYNIEKKNENNYRITMAVAGYDLDELELVQNGAELCVTGRKKPDPEQRQVLHQGLAIGNFRQAFRLADHVRVKAATLNCGLLAIELVREVPEELKPRRIEIGVRDPENTTKSISQDVSRKAA